MIYLEVEEEFDSTHIFSVSSVGSHFYGWGRGTGVFTGGNYELYSNDESFFKRC